jgi:uncharacterized lipoprotein YajG
MKKISVFLLAIVFFAACNSEKKSNEIANSLPKLKEFVKKDSIIYGIVVYVGKDSIYQIGKSVKAKVVKIESNGVTMKTLENISITVASSKKTFSIKRGDIWIEKENELFPTREDAIKYLKAKNIYKED